MPADAAATEQDALAALPGLSRALAYESSLRTRTEGLTWAVWGLVFAGVFFMYGGATGEAAGALWFEVLWVPWILVGGALTWALWRTAALRLGGDGQRPAGVAVTLAWFGAIAAGFALALAALPSSESTALIAVGLAWLAMGGTNLVRATRTGRAHVLVIGACVLVAGLAFAFLLPGPDGPRPDAVAHFRDDLLRACVAGLVPVAVGLRQALRG